MTIFDAGAGSVSLASGDFNRDGNLDLAVANGSHTVDVLLGDGHGSFGAPTEYWVGKGGLGSAATADFNGDGALDVVVAVSNGPDSSGAVVLFGKGDGTFPLQRSFSSDATAVFVAAADFNHDHATDLVTANNLSNDISILLNSGGTFVTAASSENPAPFGQSVTFTATVAPSLISTIPTGSVTFADGTTILATVPLDQNGVASYTTSGLTTGTHTIRTKYAGDANFNPNMGQPIVEVIQ